MLDISGEFKVMHSTLSNLLHDFPDRKYMIFSLYIKKKKKFMWKDKEMVRLWHRELFHEHCMIIIKMKQKTAFMTLLML